MWNFHVDIYEVPFRSTNLAPVHNPIEKNMENMAPQRAMAAFRSGKPQKTSDRM